MKCIDLAKLVPIIKKIGSQRSNFAEENPPICQASPMPRNLDVARSEPLLTEPDSDAAEAIADLLLFAVFFIIFATMSSGASLYEYRCTPTGSAKRA